ncbi:MAG: ABC transporter substrate-binding protein [Desulforhopalus sp.]
MGLKIELTVANELESYLLCPDLDVHGAWPTRRERRLWKKTGCSSLLERRHLCCQGRCRDIQTYDPIDMGRVGSNLPPSDLVFLSAGNARDAQKIIQKLRDAGTTVPVMGGDGYDSEKVWEAHPEVMDVYYTTHVYLGVDNPDPRVRKFSQAYLAAYGGNPPDAFAALGYDSVNLLAEAIRQAKTTSPDAVRQALAGIDGFHGVTGTISYIGGRQIPGKSVTVIGVKNGQRNFIRSFKPEIIPEPEK